MAGDTHDFEYYREEYNSGDGPRAMHHFVNGGGGAYLSIGTALDWPAAAPLSRTGRSTRARRLSARSSITRPAVEMASVVVDQALQRLAGLGGSALRNV